MSNGKSMRLPFTPRPLFISGRRFRILCVQGGIQAREGGLSIDSVRAGGAAASAMTRCAMFTPRPRGMQSLKGEKARRQSGRPAKPRMPIAIGWGPPDQQGVERGAKPRPKGWTQGQPGAAEEIERVRPRRPPWPAGIMTSRAQERGKAGAADARTTLASDAAEAVLHGTQLNRVRSRATNVAMANLTAKWRLRGATAPAASPTPAIRQDSVPEGATPPRAGRSRAGFILAALNEGEGQTEAAAPAPAGPPPPLPLRRSAAKAAAVNGWGSTKITANDAAALKPARIAILVRGLGRDDRNSSDAVTRLPPAISLAFMPYAGGLSNGRKRRRNRP